MMAHEALQAPPLAPRTGFFMKSSAQSLKTASTSFLSSTFPLKDTVMNLTHIDDLVDSDEGANRGKQQALYQRDDRPPHFRVS